MQAIIMAGGFGTRISAAHPEIPKALIPVCGKPVMERQLHSLKQNGITDITVITGYLSQKIRAYFGNGSAFGVNIEYIEEAQPLGTAGGLFYVKDKIHGDFLLINCDLVFNVNIERFYEFHKKKNADITLAAHPSAHPEDSTLIDADEHGRVNTFIWKEAERPPKYKNLTNAGIHIISPRILESFKSPDKTDLDRQTISRYINNGRVYAYITDEYITDMGTPERLASVEGDIEYGKTAQQGVRK